MALIGIRKFFSRGIAGEILEVRRSGGELHLDWRIPRFLDLDCGDHDFYDSPHFNFYGARWHLRVYTNRRSSGEVHLFLYRDHDDGGPSAKRVIYSWGVRGSGGGVQGRTKEEEREFEKGGGYLSVGIFQRSELREQMDRLMKGGTITFVCQMKVPGTAATGASSSPDVPTQTNTQTRESNARTCKCQSLDKQGKRTAGAL